jgi:hypothetical protein
MIEISCLSSVPYFYFFYTLVGSTNLAAVDEADLLKALMFLLRRGNKRFDGLVKILLNILIY